MESNSKLDNDLIIIKEQPPVYTMNLNEIPVDELYDVYSNQILIAATTCEIEKALIDYMNTVIEPVGWNAVWRASKESSGLTTECDFLVEVIDVSMTSLRSTIKILGIIEFEGIDDLLKSDEFQYLHQLSESGLTVPLIELHLVSESDDEEFFLKTAVAIEYIRFFCLNIWRPWDDEDDDDVVFSEKHLRRRLKLYFDIQNGLVPENMAAKVLQLLEQGALIKFKLNNLHCSMRMSDSESELEEEDVVQSIQLRMELEDLQRQLEFLENPTLRNIVVGSNISISVALSKTNERNFPVLHLVGQNISLGKIKELDWDTSIVIRTYDSPEKAITLALKNETVLIYPGVYKCLSLGWIEESVTIRGVGCPGEIVIEGSKGGGDIFLNCQAEEITLENLTLKPDRSIKTNVLVHKGKLIAKNCVFSGGDYGIIALENANAMLENSQVLYSHIDGINIRLGSKLSMRSSSIHHCEGSGLRIDGESDLSFVGPPYEVDDKISTQLTTITFHQTKFFSNRHYGIIIDAKDDIGSENEGIDLKFLKSLPWLGLIIDEPFTEHISFGLDNSNNGKGDIGLSYCAKSFQNRSVIVSSPPPYDSFLNSISRVKYLSLGSESDTCTCNNFSNIANGAEAFESSLQD